MLLRHRAAFPERAGNGHTLPTGGQYQWRTDGEQHLFNPDTLRLLQQSVRTGDYATYKTYTGQIDDQSQKLYTLRGLLAFKSAEAVPLEEVEPVESIMRRFKSGAMSYGSISLEAHQTLAIAMNRIGGKSNTGEGSEDPERYRSCQRRLEELRHQACRLGPLRCHERVPREREGAADQDGAGGQAGRRRAAAGQQGVSVDREDAPHDGGRRADLAAPAPRYLFHRGSRRADP